MLQEWRDAILLRRWQQPEMPFRDRQFGIFREIAQNLDAFTGNGRLQVARMASTPEAIQDYASDMHIRVIRAKATDEGTHTGRHA